MHRRRVVGGRFVLLDRIGMGGSGRVWRAYDLRERRYCAAKLVRQADTVTVLRVVREQALRLAHPHVVTPYAWAADDEDVLLAMELVSGGSLETLINDYGRLPPAYAAEILDQLLTALGHIHSHGVIHRDVKPVNVLLEPSAVGAPHIRLADFGIALGPDAKRLTTAGFIVGTPGYLAPEVLDGAPPSPSQDLYATGLVAWRLLTGAADPAPGQRPSGPPPPGIPAPLWSLICHLSAPAPRDRPANADAARRPLTTWRPLLQFPVRTLDDELLQIFDHLPPLPEGWTPTGPKPR